MFDAVPFIAEHPFLFALIMRSAPIAELVTITTTSTTLEVSAAHIESMEESTNKEERVVFVGRYVQVK